MESTDNSIHPAGEQKSLAKSEYLAPIEVETFDGKVHIEWDPDARVTPLGQLAFFVQFLKLGHRLEPNEDW